MLKHILASMIYFDSDMSKSSNTVVYMYFDWKTVIYICVCGKCRTQFMLPMEKSVTFTGACTNEIIPSINRSFVYIAKEGRYVIIWVCQLLHHDCHDITEKLLKMALNVNYPDARSLVSFIVL
jgi:hypothetical protein